MHYLLPAWKLYHKPWPPLLHSCWHVYLYFINIHSYVILNCFSFTLIFLAFCTQPPVYKPTHVLQWNAVPPICSAFTIIPIDLLLEKADLFRNVSKTIRNVTKSIHKYNLLDLSQSCLRILRHRLSMHLVWPSELTLYWTSLCQKPRVFEMTPNPL